MYRSRSVFLCPKLQQSSAKLKVLGFGYIGNQANDPKRLSFGLCESS